MANVINTNSIKTISPDNGIDFVLVDYQKQLYKLSFPDFLSLSGGGGGGGPAVPAFPFIGDALITGSLRINATANSNLDIISSIRNVTDTGNLFLVLGNGEVWINDNQTDGTINTLNIGGNNTANSVGVLNVGVGVSGLKIVGKNSFTSLSSINGKFALELAEGSTFDNGLLNIDLAQASNSYITTLASNWNQQSGLKLHAGGNKGLFFGSVYYGDAMNINTANKKVNIGYGSTLNDGALLDLKAQGSLSTDTALRIRSSDDTYDLIKIAGINGITLGTSRIGFTYGNSVYIGQNVPAWDAGDSNVAIGYYSGSNGIGYSNVLIGAFAGSTATHYSLTAIGYNAGMHGSNNSTFVGYRAGYNITGTNNGFFGIDTGTGTGITTGSYNMIIGGSISGLSSSLNNQVILADMAGNNAIQKDAQNFTGIGYANGALFGAKLDIKAQGALSTDIVLRLRNSGDSDNILSVKGDTKIFLLGEIANARLELTKTGQNVTTLMQRVSGQAAPRFIVGSNADGGDSGQIQLDAFSGNGSTPAFTVNRLIFGQTDLTGGALYGAFGGVNSAVFVMKNSLGYAGYGTVPSTLPTDHFGMYSDDIVPGNAAPHFRTEAGDLIKLYKQSAAGITTVPDLITILTNLGLLA